MKSLLLATIACVISSAASASVIHVLTRASSAGPQANAASYRSLVESLAGTSATAGFGDGSATAFDNISNTSLFGGRNSDIATRVTVDFGVSPGSAGNWVFRTAMDFGRGGAVFLDGAPVAFTAGDMWWGGSYTNAANYFSYSSILAAGEHQLAVYGLESCCDGASQGQFLAPGRQFTTFSATDGLVNVPEPGSMALLGSGLVVMGVSLRRRRS